MLTSDQKGAIGELAVARAALERGVGVYLPFADEPADMVFEVGTRLFRVQCKWVTRYRNVIIVRCYRGRRSAAGCIRQFYSARDVDLFAAYCADVERCYLIPFDEVPPGASVHLRLAPTSNNQARRIRWARDYEFDATLRRLGAVAQLGERRAGSA